MNEISLLASSGQPAIDHVLRGLIGFCELAFPDRLSGYYLQGSYARSVRACGLTPTRWAVNGLPL